MGHFFVRLLVVTLFVFDSSSAAADSVAPSLKHNPFSQPDLSLSLSVEANKLPANKWAGMLQATLVSGSESLANVDGTLVGVGEMYLGYRLLDVGEGTATFSKDGAEIILFVGDDGDNDDED